MIRNLEVQGVKIGLRGIEPNDLAFIMSSWLRSFKDTSNFAKDIPTETFYPNHHKLLERIIARPTTKIMIAHLEESPEVILSYMVYETMPLSLVIHFMFTKHNFRRFGLAKLLFETLQVNPSQAAIEYTHKTLKAEMYLKHNKLPVIYNPYQMLGE